MKMISIEDELKNNSYPGRGIIIGRSAAVSYTHLSASIPTNWFTPTAAKI